MWGLIFSHSEQCITFRSNLKVMNSLPVKEKPLSERLLKTAYELFLRENSSFQSMFQSQQGQIRALGLQQEQGTAVFA